MTAHSTARHPHELFRIPGPLNRELRVLDLVQIVRSKLDRGVWFPPGEKHWHGATPTTAMTHIAITEFQNGKNVDWLEKVSDEQYRR